MPTKTQNRQRDFIKYKEKYDTGILTEKELILLPIEKQNEYLEKELKKNIKKNTILIKYTVIYVHKICCTIMVDIYQMKNWNDCENQTINKLDNKLEDLRIYRNILLILS